MTHLTKITHRGLFETTVAARPNRETGNETAPFMTKQPEAPFAVAVDQVPDQARPLRQASYDYDWPSVSNLSPRTGGKHY